MIYLDLSNLGLKILVNIWYTWNTPYTVYNLQFSNFKYEVLYLFFNFHHVFLNLFFESSFESLLSSSNFPKIFRSQKQKSWWQRPKGFLPMPRWITRQIESMRVTSLGFCLWVIVNEKRLNLEKTTSIVLSVLLLIYAVLYTTVLCVAM